MQNPLQNPTFQKDKNENLKKNLQGPDKNNLRVHASATAYSNNKFESIWDNFQRRQWTLRCVV